MSVSQASHDSAGTTAVHEGTYSGGLWSWVTTVDHKRIGIMYAVFAFFFFLVGGLEADRREAEAGEDPGREDRHGERQGDP